MTEKIGVGKVALVTGASSGIGQATAVEFADRGYQVAIHYFSNEKGAHETFDRIRALKHGRARVYACDVSNPAQVNQMAGDVLADFERLDVLVNNAGSLLERKQLAEMDYDLWRRVMALNLDSVFLITRAFLPRMIQQGGGCIVNVASIAGRNGGGPGAAAYAAAKGALITLTKSMAKELAQYGIRVNCINPGVIATPFHDRFSTKEMMDRFVAAIPLHRTGTSKEMAKIIAFLASDGASYLLGECIEANGGLLVD
jgi:NAD(P)-dependent dehydrogenase (short-subunit alcohol dehydrogenase family)